MISVFLRNGMASQTHTYLIMIAICDMLASIPPALTWFREFEIRKEYNYLRSADVDFIISLSKFNTVLVLTTSSTTDPSTTVSNLEAKANIRRVTSVVI
jgi:hypothetical protein